MAGSGRGRGHASFAFSMEATGFGKGAALPDVICKPPPPFPDCIWRATVLGMISDQGKKKDEEKKNLKMRRTKDKESEDYEEAEEPEEYDAEEHEEENDYIFSYFEDGDGFGVVSDDNMVEAI